MLLNEIFESIVPTVRFNTLFEAARIGREYQHLEDLLITDGAQGAVLALNELRAISENPSSMQMKWDGGAAVFWGRDETGRFVFVPANQWSKGQKLDKQGLTSEIESTGRARPGQTPEEFIEVRKNLAAKYANLWDIFEKATPPNFRGYLNGDLMFSERQIPATDGSYEFTPNKVTYRVEPNGLFGKMKTAEAFVAVHGKIDEFGAEATGNLKPVSDSVIAAFNKTPGLIVLPTQRPAVKIPSMAPIVDKALTVVKSHASAIDNVANFTAPKLTTFKKILYDYAVKRGKAGGKLDFASWLETSKVSDNHKKIILDYMSAHSKDWQVFWKVFDLVLDTKHKILDNLHKIHGAQLKNTLGISAVTGGKPGGEGFVKAMSSGGMGKLVNPAFRSAPDNPRFAPAITEANANKEVVWAFGRMNPPHYGHGGLIQTLKDEAASRGADWKLFVSPKSGDPKNPLTYEEKVKWLLAMFPELKGHLVVDAGIKTPLIAATNLYRQGYRKAVFVAGEDDMETYSKMIASGNEHGRKNPELLAQGKAFLFDPQDFKIAKRLTSATDVRKTVTDNDPKAFAKAIFGPRYNKISPDVIKKVETTLFDRVKTGMSAAPTKTPRKVAENKINGATDYITDASDRRKYIALRNMEADSFARARSAKDPIKKDHYRKMAQQHNDSANSIINKYRKDTVREDKIKGADGKACWKGYRYAGTKNGKDKCIKVNEMGLATAKKGIEKSKNALDKLQYKVASSTAGQNWNEDVNNLLRKIKHSNPKLAGIAQKYIEFGNDHPRWQTFILTILTAFITAGISATVGGASGTIAALGAKSLVDLTNNLLKGKKFTDAAIQAGLASSAGGVVSGMFAEDEKSKQ